MSSWTFAAVLPSVNHALDIDAALKQLRVMSVDPEAFALWIDEDWLLRHGDSIELPEPVLESVRQRIAYGAEIQVTLRDKSFFMTFWVAMVSSAKVLVLGWSTKLMRASHAATDRHDRLMLACVRHSGAGAVLFVNDPPDGWLGESVCVSGRFLVSGSVARGLPMNFTHAWVRQRGELPVGLRFASVGTRMDDFASFDVLGAD